MLLVAVIGRIVDEEWVIVYARALPAVGEQAGGGLAQPTARHSECAARPVGGSASGTWAYEELP